MKTHRKATLALSISLAAAFVAVPISAGTVAGFGGSTEITQIANNVELGLSYVEQVETALNSARQYKLMLDQLKKNPADFAKGMLGGALDEHLSRADDVSRLVDSLDSLNQRTRAITGEWSRAQYALDDLGARGIEIPPAQYYRGLAELARERGGEHARRFDAYRDNVSKAAEDVERVNAIVRGAQGMTTEIQGLENVVASNGVIANLLMAQIQLASEEAMLREQESEDAALARADTLDAIERANLRAERARERFMGSSGER